MAKVISHDFALDAVSRQKPTASKVRWSGVVTAIQPRAWVWRYKTCNRRHNHTGFNLWIKGEDGMVVVAISGLQQSKLGFRHGDAASGTAWPVQGKKREIADLYRAGDLQVLGRSDRTVQHEGPPFIGNAVDFAP